MTALCGGGTSAPTVGASAVTLLASGFIAVALDRFGAGWLKWVIPFLSFPELTLSTFCAGDPPAIPTFTSAESKALLNLQLGADFDSGLAKFGDLVEHLAWYDLCHCTSGSLTALPAAAAPPAGTPIYTPAAPQAAAACSSGSLVFSQDNTVSSTNNNLSPTFLPWPAGATSLRAHLVTAPASGAATFSLQLLAFSANQAPLSYPPVSIPAGAQDVTFYYQLPFGCTGVNERTSLVSGTGLTSFNYHFDVFCNGAPPSGTIVPCCPPDPATEIQLESILRMVTLIQRQSVPFAYVPSTVHTGLSGAGTLAISGLLGAKIAMTTLPGPLGRAGSFPLEIFDAGFITFGTPDGYPSSYRLEHDPQLILPPRCSAFTQLAYDLHPGVVVTITELLREP